ncbi:hypothetical protein N656DRAFT_795105 [Canariomyces notabilis]|uniref:BZIP domain-containing protein n=1 Tax=Canariomyces notabilis TaxID=2074819 RepID=A0AAN6TLR7_9PEZI|nr:hypothetical protein N656DRAFT_795105 [Canariomyces arenarius]
MAVQGQKLGQSSTSNCNRTQTLDLGQRAAGPNLGMFGLPDAAADVDGFDPSLDGGPSSQDSTAPLQLWGDNGNQGSMSTMPLCHTNIALSMHLPQQLFKACPDHLGQAIPAQSSLLGGQYLQPLTEYLPLPSTGHGGLDSDSFESEWSQTGPASWQAAAWPVDINAHATADGTVLHSDNLPSYVLNTLELEPKLRTLSMVPRPDGGQVPVWQGQDNMVSGHASEPDRRKRGQPHTDAAERGEGGAPPKRKRGRPPKHAPDTGSASYANSPILGKESNSDSDTVPSPVSPGDESDLLLLNTHNNSSISINISESNTDITVPDDTPPNSNRTAKQTRSRRGSICNGNPSKSDRDRDRNRAAASRYRAKTQAAFAQLEAEERAANDRRQSLMACASQLRDEIFLLKTELLRHADCDCPLIQGYLSHAARQACVGLKASTSAIGRMAHGWN